jgi:hypothetical protein
LPIEIGTTHIEPAGVAPRDFYARAQFFNPYAARRHLFDFGFSFRRSGEGEDFRLVINSAGAWFFKQAQQPNIASGQLAGLEERPDSINDIELIASGEENEDGGVVLSSADSVIFDLSPRDGPDLFGAVSLTASGDQTSIEIGAFQATGDETVGISAGTCAALSTFPVSHLNPIDPVSLTSTTTNASYAELTGSSHAVAVLSADVVGTVISCADIPDRE